MENIILKVYLQPRSSKNEIVGPYRDGIKVKVTAPPVDEKANEALIRFLSKELGIPPSQVEIIKGQRSREKTLSISGIKNLVDLPNSSKCLDFKGKIH
ncbi:MAG: YggU family protein [Deltaproteobacteria bacterium RBG_16_49_23]|nr:MAG: YggU family protein [Deltaproteobacteria bacterium RBG_16_49_23]